MRGMETAIGPKSSLRSQSVRRLKFPGRNDAMLTRKRRPGGGKQFSKRKSELVQKVRSRGKGMQFWRAQARSRRAFVRNGKAMNDFKWRNEMVKCAEGNRTQVRRSLCAPVL